jgi:integrase
MAKPPRLRTYLTHDEVATLLRAAKKSRHGLRNHAMILLAYRHGLRASDLVGLRWSDVDLAHRTIYRRRAKSSRSTVHLLKRDESATLEKLAHQRSASDYVFPSSGAADEPQCLLVVAQAGERAGLPIGRRQLSSPTGQDNCRRPADARLRAAVATAAAATSPTRAVTCGSSRTTWGTNRFRTRCATRSSTPTGS